MSLAINWDDGEDSGFIYFDAVTLYTQDYSGKVTQHPIDVGGNVTDHFIKSNAKYKISAVISGLDISTGSYLIQNVKGDYAPNTSIAPNPVSVNSTDLSVLTKFIPDSINQFLPDLTPTVYADAQRQDMLDQIRDLLIGLTSGETLDEKTGKFTPTVQVIDLYEYDNIKLSRVINRLVMTNVTFRETADTGYGLNCDFSFEQVNFSTLKKTEIPKDVKDSLKKKASPKNSKGKQDSKAQDAGTGENPPKDIDPLRQARE